VEPSATTTTPPVAAWAPIRAAKDPRGTPWAKRRSGDVEEAVVTSPEEVPGESNASLLAKLFDIRSFCGALFLIFGIIVTIMGFTASDADISKSAGINLALWIGPLLLVMGVIFIGWLLARPPELLHSHEMTEDDLPEQLRHHGLEAIPEHPGETPPPQTPPARRRPPAH
jgi:hypothetical protein